MKANIINISLGVVIGFLVLAGAVWLLSKVLGDHETQYAGKPMDYWQGQLNGPDTSASNQAYVVVSTIIVPQLEDVMFHDTNDSNLRLAAIRTLNGIPGIDILFTAADGRRGTAAVDLGSLGPVARAAVPALIQAAKSKDEIVREHAVTALGEIHSDPDRVIPFLITLLDDEELNDEAATALGNYGALAKSAVPKIVPLLHAPDDDAQAAAAEALKKIDPATYASGTNAPAN